MIDTRAGRNLLTGLAACLLILAGCGDETPPAEQPSKVVSDLAPRPEVDVRASLAALDPCDLLAAADVEGSASSLHACADLGDESVELRVGVPLDAHAEDALIAINGTYAVEVEGDPCRVLVPASPLTGLEIIAADCRTAREVTSAVIERLSADDAPRLAGAAAHDSCALLTRSVEKANPRLESRTLETCTAPAGSTSGNPAGPLDGTTLTLQELASSPRQVRDLHPGSSLVDLAGQPAVVTSSKAGGCRIVVRLDDPKTDAATAFAELGVWADLTSTTHGCPDLRMAAQRLVQAAAARPMAGPSSDLPYPVKG